MAVLFAFPATGLAADVRGVDWANFRYPWPKTDYEERDFHWLNWFPETVELKSGEYIFPGNCGQDCPTLAVEQIAYAWLNPYIYASADSGPKLRAAFETGDAPHHRLHRTYFVHSRHRTDRA